MLLYPRVLIVFCCLFLFSCSVAEPPEKFLQSSSFDVVKGLSDHRDYRYLELENNLKVLLVSDPRADKSAAALDVFVGSQDEPAGSEGLAHFLEHMLFLGTDKYPESGEYQAFVSSHGGSYNAYTSPRHTNYFFDIDPAFFEEGLDRFSRFFVAPLFSDQYVQREREAVHSEYLARIKNEGRRQLDALRQVMNPEHPASRFSVGSLETLRDTEQQTLQQNLMQFYQRYYAASNMALVVFSASGLDEQEQLVRQKFSQVPDFKVVKTPITTPFFEADQLPRVLEIVPEEETRELSLIFPVPDDETAYRQQSIGYLANLIGHEGEGSLLALLKACGWADSLAAGKGFSDGQHATLNVTISLTGSGMASWQEVTGKVFDYFELIRKQGAELWRYQEQARLADQRFNFQSSRGAVHTVTELAGRMHRYPAEDILRGPYRMDRFSADHIDGLLQLLSPDNLLLVKVHDSADVTGATRYYKVPFSIKSLKPFPVPGSHSEQACNAGMQLPDANPYISEQLEMIGLSGQDAPEQLPVEGFPQVDAWYAEDNKFRLPKGYIYGRVGFDEVSSLEEAALLSWLLAVINDNLNKQSYPALLAGLDFSLNQHADGFGFAVQGFSGKLPVLLKALMGELSNPAFDEGVVQRVKVSLLESLINAGKEEPYRQTFGVMNRYLRAGNYSPEELIAQLERLDTKALQSYSASLSGKDKYLRMLMAGNITRPQASQAAAIAADAVGKLIGSPDKYRDRVRRLEGLHKELFYIDHADHTYLLYVQPDDTGYISMARFVLLRQLLKAPFFNELRTEQQLGYIVAVVDSSMGRMPGLGLLIQSPKAGTSELDKAVQEFLKSYREVLVSMPEADFQRARQAAVTRLQEKPSNMAEQAARYWSDLQLLETGFDRREKIILALNELDLQSIIGAYDSFVLAQESQLMISGSKKYLD